MVYAGFGEAKPQRKRMKKRGFLTAKDAKYANYFADLHGSERKGFNRRKLR